MKYMLNAVYGDGSRQARNVDHAFDPQQSLRMGNPKVAQPGLEPAPLQRLIGGQRGYFYAAAVRRRCAGGLAE